jgi:hypothetical protein
MDFLPAAGRNFSRPGNEYHFVSMLRRLTGVLQCVAGAGLTQTPKEIEMNFPGFRKSDVWRAGLMLAAIFIVGTAAMADEHGRSVFVLTSTNNPSGNAVVVFKLDAGTSSLTLADTLSTGGKGGAGTNAGVLQFKDELGAVANFGSNSVTQLVRYDDFIGIGKTINLANGCVQPDSVALNKEHLYVVGSKCAESHAWPTGQVDGRVVNLTDPTAAQIAVGRSWAAVTLTSGSVLQLPLTEDEGALAGTNFVITLPNNANKTPLGEGFWGNILGVTPAHSPDSFAIVNENRQIFPIVGPTPPYPTNAPCWVAKGPGSIWYTGNSPGDAVSIFFSDGEGGVFYKSIALPGSPTDLTVSRDRKWLAVIYTTGGEAYVAVFSIDRHGDLTPVATSSSIGVAAFDGVAFSE